MDRQRRHRPSTAVTAVIVLLIVGAAVYFRPLMFGQSAGSGFEELAAPSLPADINWANGAPTVGTPTSGVDTLWPPTPSDAATEPLGLAPPKRSSSTDFAFLSTIRGEGDRPVRWDPCRPIRLVTNNKHAPARANELVEQAVQSISSATGLRFVIEGATVEPPTEPRPNQDTERYGNRWSPVLVAWTDPAQVPRLQGKVAGLAGPAGAAYYTADQQHWVSGTVYLDGPQFNEILQRPDGWANSRAIVIHEFAHLIGLDHVGATQEIMHETNIGQRDLGIGDLEGLRQLGNGPCFTT